MATPPPGRRSTADRKTPPSSSIVTRNGARKAKIQTRAMSAGAKPSAVVVAAKKKAQMKKKHQGDTLVRDYLQIAMDSKLKVKGPTGFVTEPRMAEHRCIWDDNYPESPQRLIGVVDRCRELQLIDQCVQFSPRAATKEELNVLHCPSIFEVLETTHQNQDAEYLEEVASRFDAVFIHPSTHEMALVAAGSTIDLVDRIVSGEVENGFAAVRPPGHHAMYAEPCGYCFYNNAALAAKHAILKNGLSRILIVDWDVHHGQATQQMFYDDPRVVYFSIHRYEHGAFWPNLRQSNFHYTGCGAGEGYTFNLPLNQTGMKDADYLAIWNQVLIPMALEYQPELVIISAGYDAAVGCPEGEMQLSPACYATLLHLLQCTCPAVCVVLEGGYCVPSLAEGAALTLRTLLGHPPPRIDSIGEPCDSVRESILNCIYAHKKYWRCYNFQPTYSIDTTVPNVSDIEKDKHIVLVRWEGDETVPDRYDTRECYPVQSDEVLRDVLGLLNQMNEATDLSIATHQVGYLYDDRMLKHTNICEPGHVECPERIMRIHERHRDYGLLTRVHQLSAREAAKEDILAVHTAAYLDKLSELSSTKLRDLNSQKESYDSVYFHPDSLESATVAAGSVLQMVDAVVTQSVGSGVCVVRPPGHHADADTPSGFCLLNNVGIAAQYAVNKHDVQRVLILDWDVHHGNGTQRMTYNSNRILYISIHRYDNGSFFPQSKDGDYTAVGAGEGEGFNVNIPWNKRGMGDTEYLAAMIQVILPVAYEFHPQLVLVSAGFDAVVGDPLGGCKVTPECFGLMTKMLRGLASGRVIVCLEGGYNVTNISYAMTLCTKALLGDPIVRQYEPHPVCNPSAIESINSVLKIHKKYWKSLKFHLALPIEDVIEKPKPSRGLIVTADNVSDLSKLANVSISSTESKDSKSPSQIDASLEEGMANLSIGKSKCDDGLHCDSDDETGDDSTEERKVNSSIPDGDNTKQMNQDVEQMETVDSGVEEAASCSNKPGPSSAPEAGPSSNDPGSSSIPEAGPSTNNLGPSLATEVGPSTNDPGPSSAFEAGTTTNVVGPSLAPEVGPSTNDPGPTLASEAGPSTNDPGPSSASEAGTSTNGVGPNLAPEACPNSNKPGPSSAPDLGPSFDGPAVCRERFERALQESGDDPGTLFQLLAQNMGSFIRGDMFAVVPQPWCPHIDGLQDIPEGVEFKQGTRCEECQRMIENWVCLHCYNVYCSRYANKHLQMHYHDTEHALALSLSDLSVWCNACEVYLHHERLYDATNNAHRCKFGEDLPRRTIEME